MNIFQMSMEEFDKWLNGEEGQKMMDDLVEHIKEEAEQNPYFFAETCWKWDCPYNSGHNRDVEMGQITTCHRWKNGEEHEPCPDLEEDWVI